MSSAGHRCYITVLSNNEIQTFHSEAFSDTRRVEELLLANNRIPRITDVSFMIDSLPLLRKLDLSRNLVDEESFIDIEDNFVS